MKTRSALIALLIFVSGVLGVPLAGEAAESSGRKVYIIPIRDDIMPPMVYLVRRGVKGAMEAKADLLVLDMDTNGGRVDSMMEIIKAIDMFKGRTATYVNHKAFSAGALMSFATEKIYMAPGSVVGAAAPVMESPTGGGIEAMPDTMEVKSASAISALMRVSAEKHGHNTEVIDAMVKKTAELILDGKVINRKGEILTLTDLQACAEYGTPPRRLLSEGTVEDLDQLLIKLGLGGAAVTYVKPTGAEQVAFWINAISRLLLIIGIIGVYIEFKTPGFGLPGIVGIVAFALYFFGGYVAGLSGMEWTAAFIVGLALVALELFVFPGTAILGVAGAVLMLVALVMAMVDVYPGMPVIPTFDKLELPLTNLVIAFAGAALAMWVLSRILPRTPLYGKMVSQTASGVASVAEREQKQAARVGQVGIAVSRLRPGGQARFGDSILDVISQGELIEKGSRVRIIGHSGMEAIVEVMS